MKKQIMSIAAIAAIFTTGAMAFDMEQNGTIINRIYNDASATPVQVKQLASYVGGVEANATLILSPNRQGDALIYPAFRSGDGWSTEISVRNTKDVAVIAKAVLYAKDDSRELRDFNIYLSPHDVAKFTIKDYTITSTDGSIATAASVPHLGQTADQVEFASDTNEFKLEMLANNRADAGYVIIYGMTQQVTTGTTTAAKTADLAIYHEKHTELFQDYRRMLDVCRDVDNNNTTQDISWRKTFTTAVTTTQLSNGTAVDMTNQFLFPSVDANCTINGRFTAAYALDANFTSPSADALFGEVGISHEGDKRSLLLPATALANYTADNQMMLWAEGEYASIQDRRVQDNNSTTASTYVTSTSASITYGQESLLVDSLAFLVNNAYFSFEKGVLEAKNEYAFIVTQPMKRALIMADHSGAGYWTATNLTNLTAKPVWGSFSLAKTIWTEDEKTLTAAALGLVPLNSPLEGNPELIAKYIPEVATFNYSDMVDGFDDSELDFIGGNEDGYIDMSLSLPAIVSQMDSKNIDGEAQINWIYSATSRD